MRFFICSRPDAACVTLSVVTISLIKRRGTHKKVRIFFFSGLFGGLFKRSVKDSKIKKEPSPPSVDSIPSQQVHVLPLQRTQQGNVSSPLYRTDSIKNAISFRMSNQFLGKGRVGCDRERYCKDVNISAERPLSQPSYN